MDIRCTTKARQWVVRNQDRKHDRFRPKWWWFSKGNWIFLFQGNQMVGEILFHLGWWVCFFFAFTLVGNVAYLWYGSTWAISKKVGQRRPGQSLQESRCWPWQIQYVNWYIGSWVWKVLRIPCLFWKLRILYTLSFNCFGIGATGVSLLFEFCHMNFYIFRMHYHSKLDIQTIINTSSEHTSSITTSPKKRISLMYCLGTGLGLFPAYVG